MTAKQAPKLLEYSFEETTNCEMCGDDTRYHKILGQRLNQSQGLHPKRKTGIAVSVVRCRNCQLIYAQPMPIPRDFNQHYGISPEDYWREGHLYFDEKHFLPEIKAAKELLPFKEGMKALDIGAGFGRTMTALTNAGFDTYGFEPSAPFYEKAISSMGIQPGKLKFGMIENIDYPEKTFDLISFGAVFEHLYHPAASLEKAIKWLKPGGIIHIEVPSSRYYIARLFNFYYRLRGTNYVSNLSPMHVPYHLYEFGLRSFEFLGKKLGYRIERHRFEVCDIMLIPKIFRPFLRKYMEWTNTGMQLTVYLRNE